MPAFAPAIARSLIAATLLLVALPIASAEAGGPMRVLAREPMPTKSETCKPRWPYVVLTCIG